MIKVEVTKKDIQIIGHAMYDDYGKDIVCAAVSGVVTTSVESIAAFNENAIDVKEAKDKLTIVINSHDEITTKLINTMINLLSELSKKYPEYGLEKHKGYGTKEHIDAIKKYGLTPLHRKSFCQKFV